MLAATLPVESTRRPVAFPFAICGAAPVNTKAAALPEPDFRPKKLEVAPTLNTPAPVPVKLSVASAALPSRVQEQFDATLRLGLASAPLMVTAAVPDAEIAPTASDALPKLAD
jgi:hypothetical protein